MLYISQLKLRNFKSFEFANIALPKSFMCLAGPNGSGKSNLTDAIRFALGETSLRSLRARKVRDLIHTGSQTAEVTLVFDGIKKYEIKRAIRRDGKILYKFNGKKTTRTSITDEMKKYNLDDSGRNVIAQGQVRRIIEMSGKERRAIIDSVAGISDFDDKKKEAMGELGIVDTRVRESNLVLGEREAFIAELGKEREAALDYLESKKNLNNARGSLITLEVEKLNTTLETVLKDDARARAALLKKEAELKGVDSQIAQVEKERSTTSAELQLKQQASQLIKKIEELKSAISSKEEIIRDRENSIGKMDDAHKLLSKETATEEKQLSSLEKELEKIKHELKLAQQEKSEFTESKEGAQIEEMRSKIKEASKMLASSKENLIRIETEAKAKAQVIETKQDMLKGLGLIAGESKKEDLEEKAQKLRKQSKEFSIELEECFKQTKEHNLEIAEIDKKSLELKEQASMLRMRVSPAAQNPALRFIFSMKEKGTRGIHGTVAELIKFETKFAGAIEAAAGGRLLYVVVDDVDVASDIIDKLKAGKMGRATFIPLREVRASEPRAVKGALQLMNLLDYPGTIEKAIRYVFADTSLVNSMQEAKKLGSSSGRLVTLDGEIFEQSGIVTGGKTESSVLLSSQLRKLEDEITSLKSRKDDLMQALYANRDSESEIRAEKTKLEIEIKSLEMELRNVEEKAQADSGRAKRKQEIEAEIEEMKESIKNSHAQMQEELEAIKLADKSLLHLNALLESTENKAKQESSAANKKRLEVTARLSALEATFEGKENELTLRKNELLAKEERAKGMEKEKKEISQNISELKKQMLKEGEELSKHEASVKKYSREIEQLFEAMKKYEKELQELGKVRGERRMESDKLSRELSQIEIKKATSETHLQDLKGELSNFKEFELLRIERDELMKMRKVAEEKITSLGNVNLAAIEMYEKKKEEVKDIRERIDKLAQERESVIKMINEIDERKKEAFFETFDSVSENFSKMFKYLTIGEGYLQLDKPTTPFESGMFIKLKRGGTEHSLDSLSGGESSLVTLMFIFALQFYKPSPFYILDEVDAALDKENSKNLAQLIKQVAKDSQFIVVSHNDMVMSTAEAVLGVTRVNDSSKIVGVKLEGPLAEVPREGA